MNTLDVLRQQLLTLNPEDGILLISSMDLPFNPGQALPAVANCQSLQTVAALIPKCKTDKSVHAQLAFAIEHLKIRHIVLLGHSDSHIMMDLLTRLIERNLARGPIEEWCRMAEPAVQQAMQEQKTMQDLCDDATKQALLISQRHLLSYECVEEGMNEGLLQLHTWFLDAATRNISQWQGESETFQTGLTTKHTVKAVA